jgi:hypothetical protein
MGNCSNFAQKTIFFQYSATRCQRIEVHDVLRQHLIGKCFQSKSLMNKPFKEIIVFSAPSEELVREAVNECKLFCAERLDATKQRIIHQPTINECRNVATELKLVTRHS